MNKTAPKLIKVVYLLFELSCRFLRTAKNFEDTISEMLANTFWRSIKKRLERMS